MRRIKILESGSLIEMCRTRTIASLGPKQELGLSLWTYTSRFGHARQVAEIDVYLGGFLLWRVLTFHWFIVYYSTFLLSCLQPPSALWIEVLIF